MVSYQSAARASEAYLRRNAKEVALCSMVAWTLFVLALECAPLFHERYGNQFLRYSAAVLHNFVLTRRFALFLCGTGLAYLLWRLLKGEVVLYHGVPMSRRYVRDLNMCVEASVAAIAKANEADMPKRLTQFEEAVRLINAAKLALDEAQATRVLKDTLDGMAVYDAEDDIDALEALENDPENDDPDDFYGELLGPGDPIRRMRDPVPKGTPTIALKAAARLDRIKREYIHYEGDDKDDAKEARILKRKLVVAYAAVLARVEKRYDSGLTRRLRRAHLVCELANHVRAQFGGAPSQRNPINERDARNWMTSYLGQFDEYRQLDSEWKAGVVTQALPLCYVRELDEAVAEHYAASRGALPCAPAPRA